MWDIEASALLEAAMEQPGEPGVLAGVVKPVDLSQQLWVVRDGFRQPMEISLPRDVAIKAAPFGAVVNPFAQAFAFAVVNETCFEVLLGGIGRGAGSTMLEEGFDRGREIGVFTHGVRNDAFVLLR